MTTKKRGLSDNPLFTKTEDTLAKTPAEQQAEQSYEQQDPQSQATQSESPLPEGASGTPNRSTTPPQPTPEPDQVSTNQSTTPSTNQLTNPALPSPAEHQSVNLSTRYIMNRPAAFYLYEDQSEDIDNLVNLLKKKYKIKTDRSAVLRAVLTAPILNYYDDTQYSELIRRLMEQSMSRLISQ